jgi:hypothetical protein
MRRMDSRRRRQAENEMALRAINEQIQGLGSELFDRDTEGTKVWEFVCECHHSECVERVALTIVEYEAVRVNGKRFVVSPGVDHVDMDIENVVDMSTRYWVVEKTDESGELAQADDPRD